MEQEGKIKKFKISKLRMGFKFIKMFFYKVIKRRWYLPTIPEITVDELFDCINSNMPPLILDHRPAEEFNGNGQNSYMTIFGHIPNSQNMGIMKLSSNLEDLQSFMKLVTNLNDLQIFKEKQIVTICPGGGMSLIAVEIMVEAGFKDVKSLKGGIAEWNKKGYPLITTTEDAITPQEDIKLSKSEERTKIIKGKQPLDEKSMTEAHNTVDARGLLCPKPILKSRKAIKALKINQVLEILTTDPGSLTDIPSWALATGQELLFSEELGPKEFRFLVKRLK